MTAFLRRRVEHLLNLALDLDVESRAGLRALAGKCIDLHIIDLDIACRLQPQASGLIHISAVDEDVAELSVRTKLTHLLEALSTRTAPTDGLMVRGDVELLKQLEQLVRGYSPDVEGLLAGIIGDIAAHQACKAGRGTGALAINIARKLPADIGAYLKENELAPGHAEVVGFIDTVDKLRDRIERLAERVRGLERRAPG